MWFILYYRERGMKKSVFKVVKSSFVVLIIIACLCISVACSFQSEVNTIEDNSNLNNGTNNGLSVDVVNTSNTYQVHEGFGGSAAWAYQDLGVEAPEAVQNEAMEMLYGDTGLKLNIYRYLISAGGRETGFNYVDDVRAGESFFDYDVAQQILNGSKDYSEFNNIDNYDFTKDEGSRVLFEKALAYGNINHVVFFANSPHYTMTVNKGYTHQSSGTKDNHNPDTYDEFATYILLIADKLTEMYIDPIEEKYGIDIKVTISPINEPQWAWAENGNTTQEGCHYEPSSCAKMYQTFYTAMKKFNQEKGRDFTLDIFESGSINIDKDVRSYMEAFAEYDYEGGFFAEVEEIAVHSYWHDLLDDDKTAFKNYIDTNYPGVKIAMSEYSLIGSDANNNTNGWGISPYIDMGILNARVILKDLLYMNSTKWIYWLSVSRNSYNGEWEPYGAYEDGLVYWKGYKTPEEEDYVFVTKRYYTMGNFSRYIDVGAVRVDTTIVNGKTDCEAVAYKNPDGKIVLVVINNSNNEYSQQLTGNFNHILKCTTNSERNWFETVQYDKNITIPAKSVTTFVFS